MSASRTAWRRLEAAGVVPVGCRELAALAPLLPAVLAVGHDVMVKLDGPRGRRRWTIGYFPVVPPTSSEGRLGGRVDVEVPEDGLAWLCSELLELAEPPAPADDDVLPAVVDHVAAIGAPARVVICTIRAARRPRLEVLVSGGDGGHLRSEGDDVETAFAPALVLALH